MASAQESRGADLQEQDEYDEVDDFQASHRKEFAHSIRKSYRNCGPYRGWNCAEYTCCSLSYPLRRHENIAVLRGSYPSQNNRSL